MDIHIKNEISHSKIIHIHSTEMDNKFMDNRNEKKIVEINTKLHENIQ